jgi:hypothetical protein
MVGLFDVVFGVILIVIGLWLWRAPMGRHWVIRIFAVIIGIVGLYLFLSGLLV